MAPRRKGKGEGQLIEALLRRKSADGVAVGGTVRFGGRINVLNAC